MKQGAVSYGRFYVSGELLSCELSVVPTSIEFGLKPCGLMEKQCINFRNSFQNFFWEFSRSCYSDSLMNSLWGHSRIFFFEIFPEDPSHISSVVLSDILSRDAR